MIQKIIQNMPMIKYKKHITIKNLIGKIVWVLEDNIQSIKLSDIHLILILYKIIWFKFQNIPILVIMLNMF